VALPNASYFYSFLIHQDLHAKITTVLNQGDYLIINRHETVWTRETKQHQCRHREETEEVTDIGEVINDVTESR
jgi:hypothetical protein